MYLYCAKLMVPKPYEYAEPTYLLVKFLSPINPSGVPRVPLVQGFNVQELQVVVCALKEINKFLLYVFYLLR